MLEFDRSNRYRDSLFVAQRKATPDMSSTVSTPMMYTTVISIVFSLGTGRFRLVAIAPPLAIPAVTIAD